MSHKDHEHKFEIDYWGNCVNSFDEEQKHYVYANFMGIPIIGYSFDAGEKRILDIGGGPVSMLLKCRKLVEGKVCDPIDYPKWTKERYNSHNISVNVISGEDVNETGWDEVWIYNCLQHVDSVEKIINNAKRAAPVLRIFEWINIPPHPGHPHMLTKEILDKLIAVPGSGTVTLSERGCYGTAYYGVFKHNNTLVKLKKEIPLSKNNLTSLANKYKSDKGDTYLCAHNYTKIYQKYFESYLNKDNFSILEIGLNRETPTDVPSLKMLRDFFGTKAQITGFDINNEFLKFKDAFNIVIGDQSNLSDLEKLKVRSYDIVIDDGSHASTHQQITLKSIWDTVKDGGLYVIEDLHWQPYEENTIKTSKLATEWIANNWLTTEVLDSEWISKFKDEVAEIRLYPSESKLYDKKLTKNALLVIRKSKKK